MSLARIAAILVVLATSGVAAADGSPKAKESDEIVFVGLLPLSKPGGKGDLVGLKAAQRIRGVVEGALSTLSSQPVFGHDALTARLGKAYLPKWFECQTDITCLSRVLAPLRDAGNRLAVTAEYYVQDGTYHVRVVSFFVVDGTVSKELKLELPSASVEDRAHWAEALKPLLATRVGRIRIGSNVGDVTCKIDGADCAFESDGQTVSAPPGEHTIELSKEDYLPEKVVVNVETGTTQEVAIALKRKDTGGKVVATVEGPRRKPTLSAVRTDKVVEIDGKLDEPAWQKAWLETNFTQNFPDEAKSPSQRTELRVLYDDDALYIGVRCFDAEPSKIVSRFTRRDRDAEADKVTIDISSKNDHTTSYTFSVNAAGVLLDGTRFNDTDSSTDWDGVWYANTSIDDKGWIAELKIPLAALRYSGDTSSFGFQVRRYIQRRKETDEWSYVPRDARGEVSYYGTLDGLTGLHAKRLVQITPYDSRSMTYRTKQNELNGASYGGSFGVDAKIGLTPSLTFDATVNPDFGTVEVDQVVLNLSTFETYFPEKRPFFLEGADIFDMMQQVLYSRRIGHTPEGANVNGFYPDGIHYLRPPPNGQIIAAGKVTGFLANRLSIGVVDAVTDREDALISRGPGLSSESVLVDPTTNYGVVRLRQDFGLNSSIGVAATSVTRFEPRDRAAPQPGDFCPLPHFGLNATGPGPDGRCFSDAYTGAADTVLRTGDGQWGVSGQVTVSTLEHGPDRLVPDGTTIAPGDVGWGVATDMGKFGGEYWLYSLHYEYLSPTFEINDAGFSSKQNKQLLDSTLTLRSTKEMFGVLNPLAKLRFRYETPGDIFKPVFTGQSLGDSWSGVLAGGDFTLPSFWQIHAAVARVLSGYNNRETHDGALLQTAEGWKTFFNVASDPRKAVSFGSDLGTISTTRGQLIDLAMGFGLRPHPALEFDLLSEVQWSYGDPRWIGPYIDNGNGMRTYNFSDLDSRSVTATLRGTWTLLPTLSLQFYTQVFLDAGNFGKQTQVIGAGKHSLLDLDRFTPASFASPDGFRDSAFNVNAFLRWEFRPGSTLWLVYTRAQNNLPYDQAIEGQGQLRVDKLFGPSSDVILVKLSYLWEPLSGRH